jgi:WD40 repeat protein
MANIWLLAVKTSSPDGRYLASCSIEKTVKLWSVGSQKEIAKASVKNIDHYKFFSEITTKMCGFFFFFGNLREKYI